MAADTHWRGRRVWIVGASSGIGATLAEHLLACGARVAVSARRQAPLDAFRARHAEAVALPCDATDAQAMERACAALEVRWGGIDLMVFAAGAYREMRADDFDAAAAAQLADVNLKGCYHAVGAVLPMLLRQGSGALAVLSSVAGFRGLPRALAYGPTKAALINFCEVLQLDLAPRGIGVHLVNPGFVATPMTAANEFPMPALATPEDAARAIAAGIARGDFHIHFPRRFTFWLRLARLLPYPLYFALVRKVTGT